MHGIKGEVHKWTHTHITGHRSETDAVKHINYFELKTVSLVLNAFQGQIQKKVVQGLTHTKQPVLYVNKQLGTESYPLLNIT